MIKEYVKDDIGDVSVLEPSLVSDRAGTSAPEAARAACTWR